MLTDQKLVLSYLADYLEEDRYSPPEDIEDRILVGYAQALGRAHRLQGATPMDRRDVVPLIRAKAQEGHTVDRLHEIIAAAGQHLDGR